MLGSITGGEPEELAQVASRKIHTIAPNDAEIENRLVSTAFNGTTDPVSKNRTRYVIRITVPTAIGVLSRMKLTMSRSNGQPPARGPDRRPQLRPSLLDDVSRVVARTACS